MPPEIRAIILDYLAQLRHVDRTRRIHYELDWRKMEFCRFCLSLPLVPEFAAYNWALHLALAHEELLIGLQAPPNH